MTREEAIKVLENATIEPTWGGSFRATSEALDRAIEALKRETHDGCDGCMYEHYEELTEPCASCKQNYMDRYMPMPKHDRDWIVGCIEHDGFIKTDRGDKANQIILEALKADRPRGEWVDDNRTYYANCSKCGYQMDTHEERGYHNFCPNCGADRRGGTNG